MQKKVKLESLIASQLPAHIREDYPTFEAFMKAYYKFLDNQQLTRNLEFVRDIDDTLDQFLEYIKDEIAVLAPRLAKDRFFLKHAKEFYVSRGSEESYKFLFRVLYNKNVDIVQLNDKMLKASGGNWQQDTSFFIKLESGSISNIENNFLFIDSVTESGVRQKHERVYVTKVQRVEFVAQENVYEVFINRQFFGRLQAGDTINDRGIKATIIPTTTGIDIVNPGSGFRIGQIFNINTNLGTGLQAKVVNVDRATGALKALQIISFGVGFEQPFDYNITKFDVAKSSQTIIPNVDGDLAKVNTTDVLSEGQDSGYVTRQSYHGEPGSNPNSAYAAGDYVGEVLADFFARNYPDEIEVTVATLRIKLGALAVYPGFYRNSQSLISDDSYIQDGYYYQDFSYLLRIDEKLTDYKEVITSTLHPVGRKMFGDFLVEQDYNLVYEVFNPIIRLFFPSGPEQDESFDALDKVLSSVISEEFAGNGSNLSFTFLDEPTGVNHVLLNVRKGFGADLSVVPTTLYTVSNGVVTFYSAPLAGERVITTYATINYNLNVNWLDHTLDMIKPLSDVTDGTVDNAVKNTSKILNPSTGYVDEVLPNTTLRTNLTSKVLSNATGYTNELVTLDSAISTKAFGKRLTDPTDGSTDAHVFDMSKPLLDITDGSFDAATKLTTKLLDPTTGYVDEVLPDTTSRINAFTKILDDSSGYTDEFVTLESTSTAVSFDRPLADATDGSTDSASNLTSKALTDSIAPSTTSVISVFDKALDDLIDPLDILTYSITKLLTPEYSNGEIVEAIDSPAIGLEKAPFSSENITLEHSVPVVDITKALEDVVNSSISTVPGCNSIRIALRPISPTDIKVVVTPIYKEKL